MFSLSLRWFFQCPGQTWTLCTVLFYHRDANLSPVKECSRRCLKQCKHQCAPAPPPPPMILHEAYLHIYIRGCLTTNRCLVTLSAGSPAANGSSVALLPRLLITVEVEAEWLALLPVACRRGRAFNFLRKACFILGNLQHVLFFLTPTSLNWHWQFNYVEQGKNTAR